MGVPRVMILGIVLAGAGGLGGAAMAQEAPPAAPTELTAVPFADAPVIEIRWRDNADNEQSYVVERSIFGTALTWDEIETLPQDTESYIDGLGLEPGMTYYYRVVAENEAGRSEYSNVVAAEAAFPFPSPDQARPTPIRVLPETGTGAFSPSGLPLGLLFASSSLAATAIVLLGWAMWRRAT